MSPATPMRGPLSRPAAPTTPAPAASAPAAHDPNLDVKVGGALADHQESAPLDLGNAGNEEAKPVITRTVDGAAKPLGANSKEMVTFVKECVIQATARKDMNEASAAIHARQIGDANDAAYFQVIKPNNLKSTGMQMAARVGTMIGSEVLASVSYMPKGRTIEQEVEALGVTVAKRAERIKSAVETTKPEHQAAAAESAEFDLKALDMIKETGALALANGNHQAVRALNGLLQGQGNVSYTGYTQRQAAGVEAGVEGSGIRENFPVYREARPLAITQGIKKPEFLLKKVLEATTVTVTDADRFYMKDGQQQEVQPKTAEAKARLRQATEICHMLAVPALFEENKEYLVALGRKHAAKELTEQQIEGVNLLKADLSAAAQNIPAELTPELREALEGGVRVEGRDGEEVFSIADTEAQDEFFAHLKASAEGGNDKADNYFGKMWKSREMAHALVQNYFQEQA